MQQEHQLESLENGYAQTMEEEEEELGEDFGGRQQQQVAASLSPAGILQIIRKNKSQTAQLHKICGKNNSLQKENKMLKGQLDELRNFLEKQKIAAADVTTSYSDKDNQIQAHANTIQQLELMNQEMQMKIRNLETKYQNTADLLTAQVKENKEKETQIGKTDSTVAKQQRELQSCKDKLAKLEARQSLIGESGLTDGGVAFCDHFLLRRVPAPAKVEKYLARRKQLLAERRGIKATDLEPDVKEEKIRKLYLTSIDLDETLAFDEGEEDELEDEDGANFRVPLLPPKLPAKLGKPKSAAASTSLQKAPFGGGEPVLSKAQQILQRQYNIGASGEGAPTRKTGMVQPMRPQDYPPRKRKVSDHLEDSSSSGEEADPALVQQATTFGRKLSSETKISPLRHSYAVPNPKEKVPEKKKRTKISSQSDEANEATLRKHSRPLRPGAHAAPSGSRSSEFTDQETEPSSGAAEQRAEIEHSNICVPDNQAAIGNNVGHTSCPDVAAETADTQGPTEATGDKVGPGVEESPAVDVSRTEQLSPIRPLSPEQPQLSPPLSPEQLLEVDLGQTEEGKGTETVVGNNSLDLQYDGSDETGTDGRIEEDTNEVFAAAVQLETPSTVEAAETECATTVEAAEKGTESDVRPDSQTDKNEQKGAVEESGKEPHGELAETSLSNSDGPLMIVTENEVATEEEEPAATLPKETGSRSWSRLNWKQTESPEKSTGRKRTLPPESLNPAEMIVLGACLPKKGAVRGGRLPVTKLPHQSSTKKVEKIVAGIMEELLKKKRSSQVQAEELKKKLAGERVSVEALAYSLAEYITQEVSSDQRRPLSHAKNSECKVTSLAEGKIVALVKELCRISDDWQELWAALVPAMEKKLLSTNGTDRVRFCTSIRMYSRACEYGKQESSFRRMMKSVICRCDRQTVIDVLQFMAGMLPLEFKEEYRSQQFEPYKKLFCAMLARAGETVFARVCGWLRRVLPEFDTETEVIKYTPDMTAKAMTHFAQMTRIHPFLVAWDEEKEMERVVIPSALQESLNAATVMFENLDEDTQQSQFLMMEASFDGFFRAWRRSREDHYQIDQENAVTILLFGRLFSVLCKEKCRQKPAVARKILKHLEFGLKNVLNESGDTACESDVVVAFCLLDFMFRLSLYGPNPVKRKVEKLEGAISGKKAELLKEIKLT